jgi:hypothetical protein
LLNPIFFVAMVWAGIAFWRRARHSPKLVYFFSMGAPLFLVFMVHSFHGRILPNWIAPCVLPLGCMMVIYWDTQLRLGVVAVKRWLTAGLIFGFVTVLVCHNTDVIGKVSGWYLPVWLDPLHRVRGWSETARLAGEVRDELLAEGKPVFIITDHYGMAGQISFYLPEAKAAVKSEPLVYFRSSRIPENQFFFWPGYSDRKGQSAIFVQQLDRTKPEPGNPPEQLLNEFESVSDLGMRNVMYHGHLLRPMQFFVCRGLR